LYDLFVGAGLLGPGQSDKVSQPTRIDRSGSHDLGLKTLLARGRKYASVGQYAHAADCLRRVLKLQDDPGLAMELAKQGKLAEAKSVPPRQT
jgi:hypothetical protein